MAIPVSPLRPANPVAPVASLAPRPAAERRRDREESEPAQEGGAPAELADEDEATLRAELPADFPHEVEGLGRPRFRVERTVLPDNAFKPAFLAIVCCIPGLLCIFGGPLLPTVLGLLWNGSLIAFAVWWIARQLRKKKVFAVVYTGGFVHYDGRRYITWRWADVAAVNMQNIDFRSLVLFIPVHRFLTKFYRLRHRDGPEYQFWSTWGPRAAQIGLLVEKETFARMMPAAVAELQAGREVEFWPFRMRPTGLVYRDHFTPWPEIESASIEGGRLHLRGVGPAGGKASVLLEKIDNHHVFLTLLDQKVRLRPGE